MFTLPYYHILSRTITAGGGRPAGNNQRHIVQLQRNIHVGICICISWLLKHRTYAILTHHITPGGERPAPTKVYLLVNIN